MAFGPPQAPA